MATNGHIGRFAERLRKIRLNRFKNKKQQIELEDSNIMYSNFTKIVAAIPLMVYDNVFDKSVNKNMNKVILNDDNSIISDNVNNNRKYEFNNFDFKGNVDNDRKKKREIIESINVSSMKKKQNFLYKLGNNIELNDNKDNVNQDDDELLEDKIKELEKKIINLIKKDLIVMVNEYEILESELYILNEINGDEKTLIECRKNIDEIKKMICKIDILKSKYEFLKDNYDFEYFMEMDNNELYENIMELKKLVDNDRVKLMVEDYKLLDAYKYLYLRIDKIHEDCEEYESEKVEKVKELEKRDIDFEKLKSKVYNVESFNESYDSFVREQNRLLKELEENIGNIDKNEFIDYKIVGLGDLIINSFKYLTLLMMNPLKGVLPCISTQTLITRNVVSNMYKNLKVEEDRMVVYHTEDYSSVISNAINDIDGTNRRVDDVLDNLVRMKMWYNDQFKQYQGDFSQYNDVIRRINDMENKILGNKIKIEIMKKKMREKELENQEVLKRVRKLNERENI